MAKEKSPKFTFKTKKATGRYRSFYSDQHEIKLQGHKIGSIEDTPPHKIHIAVEKTEEELKIQPQCSWKWIVFKKDHDSVEAAKTWLNEHTETIVNKLNIHKFAKD